MTVRTYDKSRVCPYGEYCDARKSDACACCCSRSPTVHDWLHELNKGTLTPPFEIVEVAFKGRRTDFFHNEPAIELRPGDPVVVEADRGTDFGTVYTLGELVRVRLRSLGLKTDESYPRIVRLATGADTEAMRDARITEQRDLEIAEQHINEFRLPMKLVDVEWQFDRNKVTFYYTADRRVDFRMLIRKLARTFHARVELRQIGARDQSSMVGGLGVCGRELCCSSWLRSFAPVSTEAARIQSLTLTPTRVSGQCGRLKCCLNYEVKNYEPGRR